MPNGTPSANSGWSFPQREGDRWTWHNGWKRTPMLRCDAGVGVGACPRADLKNQMRFSFNWPGALCRFLVQPSRRDKIHQCALHQDRRPKKPRPSNLNVQIPTVFLNSNFQISKSTFETTNLNSLASIHAGHCTSFVAMLSQLKPNATSLC